MENIFEKNYRLVKQLGKITDRTTKREFELKLHEELWEVATAETEEDKVLEIADLMLTCTSYLIHLGYQPDSIIEQAVNKNADRVEKYWPYYKPESE
jgi:phosphoribosyl-ATP pyrophosphohydrolase